MRARAKTNVMSMLLMLTAMAMVLSGCIAGKVRAGDRDARRGRWFEALAHYERALAKKPDDKRIQNRVRQAKIQISNIFVGRAEAASRKGQLLDAIGLYGDALQYNEANTQARSGANAVSDKLIARGDDALAEDNLEVAAVSYRAVYRVLPNYKDIRAKHTDTSQKFASELRARAQNDLKNDWCGNALVAAARSLAYDQRQEASELMSRAKGCLSARTGIYPVFAPTPQRTLISDAVMGNLYRIIGDVPGFYPANAKAPRRDDETLIFVELLNHQEVEDVDEERKTTRESRDGTETRNYQQLEEQRDALEDKLEDLQDEREQIVNVQVGEKPPRSLAECDAEIAEVKDKIEELNAELEELESVTVKIVYTVNTVTRRSIARWFIRIDDPVIGRWDKTLDVEVSATDTHIPKPRGSNSIKEDPLELPPYSELAHQLSDRSTEVLMGALQEAREARRARLIQEAKTMEAQGDLRKAIESYADAAFMGPRVSGPAGSFLGYQAEMDPGTLLQ